MVHGHPLARYGVEFPRVCLILGPLLLLYISDLFNESKVLFSVTHHKPMVYS